MKESEVDTFKIGYSYGIDAGMSLDSLLLENKGLNVLQLISGFEAGRNTINDSLKN